MTTYHGTDIELNYNGSEVTGVQNFSFDMGHDYEVVRQLNSREVQEIKEGNKQAVTFSFMRRFDVYNSDWIVHANYTGDVATFTLYVSHASSNTLTISSCILTGYSYSIRQDGLAEETIEGVGMSMSGAA